MSTPKVYTAIAAVMEDIGKEGIAKTRRNQQQGYQFRGIDDVFNELNGLLSKHRLIMLPRVAECEREERATQKGGVLIYTRLTVDFKLVSAEDGSSDTIRTVGEAMDSADKSSNKAQSAAYKYAALMVFCIPTEAENDADAVTHDIAPKDAAPPKNTDARAVYTMLEKVMRAKRTKADLRAWITSADTKAHMAKLPPDWTKNLRGAAKELAATLPEDIPPEDVFPGDLPPNGRDARHMMAG